MLLKMGSNGKTVQVLYCWPYFREGGRARENILLRGSHVNKSCCELCNPLCQVDRKSRYSSSGKEMMYMTEHLQPQSFYCGNSAS